MGFFIMLFLSFVNLCVLDYIIWWSVFVVCTFVFIFMIKDGWALNSMINYYIIQEICGYYFLVFSNWKIQFLIVMLKSGSAPFHFWLFSIVSDLKKWFLFWFLTLQKLPYFVVLVGFCSGFYFFFLFFGLVFCFLQFFVLRDFISMLVVYSTESFNWLLLLSGFSLNEVFFFVFFYYITMFLVICYVGSGGFNFLSWELVLVFFNVPLSVTFFLKVLLLFGTGVFVGFYYLFLLFFMVLVSLGLGFWFFYVSMAGFNVGIKYYDYFFFGFFVFGLLVYF
uniref:NADH dehydrogenase subunit 2 n=1 Tax=Mastophorus muris TaxID=1499391 RepID=UPI002E77A235|nr:NADH dehydrogenase subunit 2 [Mastophorus muris]WPN85874.1 NADH dehydrogenase subunit 2 [Mastophorus muris]